MCLCYQKLMARGRSAEKATVLIYFYGPMAFLLLANLALFVYTAARILAVRKDTAILHKADNARSHSGTETQR